MRSPCLLLIPLALCLAHDASAQVVLDDFEDGAFSLTSNPNDFLVFDTLFNLNTANVLSGVREHRIFSFEIPHGGATLDLASTPGDDAVQFTATQPTAQGLDLVYDFSPALDLAALGSSFSIDIDALVDPAGDVTLLVFVGDAVMNEAVVIFASPTVGTTLLPFSSLMPTGPQAPDLSAISFITFSLETTTTFGLNDISATLDDFMVVPEPSSTLLAGTALLVIVGIRRHRRRA